MVPLENTIYVVRAIKVTDCLNDNIVVVETDRRAWSQKSERFHNVTDTVEDIIV